MMQLRDVHHSLLQRFGSSLSWTPWKWIKCAYKLERTHLQLNFLFGCRRERVVPKFILNAVKTDRLVHDHRAATKRKRYLFSVLSDVIRDKTRYRAELYRKVMSRRADMRKYSKTDYIWCRDMLECVLKFERDSSRRKLQFKFENLIRAARGHVDGTESHSPSTVGQRSSLPQTTAEVDKEELDLSRAMSEPTPTPDLCSSTSRAIEEENRAESASTPAHDQKSPLPATIAGDISHRFSTIDVTLTTDEQSLLAKGPRYTPTLRKMTDRDLRQLETNIEATAFGLRWLMNPIGVGIGTNGQSDLMKDPKIRNLSYKNKSQSQGPELPPEDERKLSRLKTDLMDLFKSYRPPRQQNLTKAERAAIDTLKSRDDVVIKQSDKSKSLVAMSTETYLAKASHILDDHINYEKSDMTAKQLEEMTLSEIEKLTSSAIKDELRTLMKPRNTRLAEFYGLPKTHKQNIPLRPVVAACDTPTTAISIVLERILNQLLPFVPAHLSNTKDALDRVKATLESWDQAACPNTSDSNIIILSMDVVGLYPSIPIQDGIACVVKFLQEHADRIDLLGLSVENIRDLLAFVLNNNYFRFGTSVYRQREGVAMGNQLAPPFAIIFMHCLEERMLRTASLKPEMYGRYIDDTLLIWLHGSDALQDFIRHCNQQHPSIRFTYESSEQGRAVPFLDVQFTVSASGEVDFGLYRKPSDSGINVDFHSAVPDALKFAVARQHFSRAQANSSSQDKTDEGIEMTRQLLRHNNYPKHTIDRVATRTPRTKRSTPYWQENAALLKVPFRCDAIQWKVRQLVRATGFPINLVLEHNPNLKDRLVRSAFQPRPCSVTLERERRKQQKRRGRPMSACLTCRSGMPENLCDSANVIYSMQCVFCSAEYVGETLRTVRERFGEHHYQARHGTPGTPWGTHMKKFHSKISIKPDDIVFKNATVLATETREARRKLREAIEIRDRKPSVNLNKGWALSH